MYKMCFFVFAARKNQSERDVMDQLASDKTEIVFFFSTFAVYRKRLISTHTKINKKLTDLGELNRLSPYFHERINVFPSQPDLSITYQTCFKIMIIYRNNIAQKLFYKFPVHKMCVSVSKKNVESGKL